jgi:hypothetical protein
MTLTEVSYYSNIIITQSFRTLHCVAKLSLLPYKLSWLPCYVSFVDGRKLKNYKVEVASGGMLFVSNFMKIFNCFKTYYGKTKTQT